MLESGSHNNKKLLFVAMINGETILIMLSNLKKKTFQ